MPGAALSSRARRQVGLRCSHARWAAVWPWRSSAMGLAPAITKSRTTDGNVVITARCSGVWGTETVKDPCPAVCPSPDPQLQSYSGARNLEHQLPQTLEPRPPGPQPHLPEVVVDIQLPAPMLEEID